MPVGPALSKYSGTPMGTPVTGCLNPFAYICFQKSIWAQDRDFAMPGGLKSCRSAGVSTQKVFQLQPQNRFETNCPWAISCL